ncbi:hypothetical protein ALC57_03165 [Trachymyrmex cornetzi]|uniref:Uncharacterized protein n=1 Tax=Trachymyrmex cornetzi TaxID=471704 RepID=A0A151JMP0_9HYME|nr:hypothetical protein ALC57_03165 [Trachymyrmex cornetzi]
MTRESRENLSRNSSGASSTTTFQLDKLVFRSSLNRTCAGRREREREYSCGDDDLRGGRLVVGRKKRKRWQCGNFPLPSRPSPSSTTTSPTRDGVTACTARLQLFIEYAFCLYLLFGIDARRHRRAAATAALHFAFMIFRRSKCGTAASST